MGYLFDCPLLAEISVDLRDVYCDLLNAVLHFIGGSGKFALSRKGMGMVRRSLNVFWNAD